MQRLVILNSLLIFSFFGLPMFAQDCKVPPCLLLLLKENQPDTVRLDLLSKLSRYYLDKPGSEKADIDSSLQFDRQALQLCEKIHNVKWKYIILTHMGNCYLDASNIEEGKSFFMQVIDYYHNTGDKVNEAISLKKMADCIPNESNQVFAEKSAIYYKARILFQQIHDTASDLLTLKTVADLHLNEGQLDLAEKELLEVLAGYKAINNKSLQYTYDLLAAVSNLKGNLDKALFYSIEAIKYVEQENDTIYKSYFYEHLAKTYENLREYGKAEGAYHKATEADLSHNPYRYIYNITETLNAEGKPQIAINYLNEVSHKKIPAGFDKLYLAYGYATSYKALHKIQMAEKYFMEMITVADELLNVEKTLTREGHSDLYIITGDFYTSINEFKKADYYLEKLQNVPIGILTQNQLSKIEFMKFQTDSATGRYLQAIIHFEKHKKITDSIFSETKSKQISEIQIKYETAKKDNDLLLKSKDVEILTNQTHLQAAEVKQSKSVRNAFIGGACLLLILLSVGYSRYRLKQRKNLELEIKQKEIFTKNTKLEKLLQENDWLLREVHHRVKNNLQIVMSLLNSQSAFLKDEAALNAMLESRQRVQAMSLIHQKLYKSNNASSIYMPEYVRDLVDYLKDSFSQTNNIYFDLLIDPIDLDVLQAVPVGLILNEVITNSIKYAFSNSADNRITIQLSRLKEAEKISLMIKDNGKGLPENFDINKNNSFGIILINGLAEDLEGNCLISSGSGTTVILTFPDSKTVIKKNIPST